MYQWLRTDGNVNLESIKLSKNSVYNHKTFTYLKRRKPASISVGTLWLYIRFEGYLGISIREYTFYTAPPSRGWFKQRICIYTVKWTPKDDHLWARFINIVIIISDIDEYDYNILNADKFLFKMV